MEHVLNSDEDHPEVIATFLDQTLQGKCLKERLDESGVSANVEAALGLVRYLVVRGHCCCYRVNDEVGV
jgi:hypothetical protein